MFKDYQSKPTVRNAHEVTDNDKIVTHTDPSTSLLINDSIPLGLTFKHYEPVAVGDFIVYLTDDDIYHCSRSVFMDRNIVE
jgi:hypothetical protein